MAANMSLIGTRGSGKSTCAGFLMLTALDIADDTKRKLRVLVEERSLPIRTIVDRLNKGIFPEPTLAGESFEATLSLRFKHFLRSNTVNLAISDVAGETLRETMDAFMVGHFELPEPAKLQDVNRYVLSANAFVLLADLERLLGDPGDTQDAQLARFIDALIRYKKFNKRSPRIRGIALVLTKYDMVKDSLAVRDQISLDYPEGWAAFVRKFMIQTYTNLRDAVGQPLVDVFYSSAYPVLDADGRPTANLRLHPETHRPEYSADEYERLLFWFEHVLG